MLETVEAPSELKPYLNDYKLNVVEVAFLTQEQISRFKSDFRIVADYFVQTRTNKDYNPSPQTIKHVHEVLQLLSIFAGDNRYEESINLLKEGESVTMCEVLDRIIARGEARGKQEGELSAFFKMIKKGFLTLDQAAKAIGMSDRKSVV